LIETEKNQPLKPVNNQKRKLYAAYDRFYKGDIAKEIVRGTRGVS